jgi:TonB family protein
MSASHLPARLITALLLIGLGIPVSYSSSLKPMQGPEQQTATPEAPPTPSPTKPNPDASGKYHVGDGVLAPRLIFSVDPEFTDKARRKRLGGTCVVSMLVDVAGTPQDVHVVSSIATSVAPKLRSIAMGQDENAVKAAKAYRFEPATFEGKPVPVEIKVEINFRIY